MGNPSTTPAVPDAGLEAFGGGFDYYIRYDHGLPAGGYYWFRKRQKVLRLIERNFDRLCPPSASLWNYADLGCGNGVDLFLVRRKVLEMAGQRLGTWSTTQPGGFGFAGIDGNPQALQVCELKKSHYTAADTEFRQDDFRYRLPFGDREFNLVYCSEVVEHLEAPEGLLCEVNRILKPGCYFLLTTPNEPNLFQRSYWDAERRPRLAAEARQNPTVLEDSGGHRISIYGHIAVRKVTEWEQALADHGFEYVDCERGALVYTTPRIGRMEFGLACQLFLEGLLDMAPTQWVRAVSDQMIGLYRKK